MAEIEVALDIIALIADVVLGILQIVPLYKGTPTSQGSIVRVGIGLYDNNDLGGDVPGITVWNEEGKKLGQVHKGGQVEAGSYVDIAVPQNPPNQQPTYIKVDGGKDSICVAYIGHAWSDGTKRGWLGDMGSLCGRPYYYSDIYVTQTNGSEYKPLCTWIGGIGTTANWTAQMTIHTPEFSAVGGSNDFTVPPDPYSLCSQPATKWSNDPIATSGSIRKASLFGVFSLMSIISGAIDLAIPIFQPSISAPASPFQTTIVGSHYFRHNSTALCSNPLSYGPDFVSFHEGVFCDMTNRRTRPLCSATETYDCYDWNTHTIVDRRLRKRKMEYSKVIEWK